MELTKEDTCMVFCALQCKDVVNQDLWRECIKKCLKKCMEES